MRHEHIHQMSKHNHKHKNVDAEDKYEGPVIEEVASEDDHHSNSEHDSHHSHSVQKLISFKI